MKIALAAFALTLAATPVARAGSLADALARHRESDVTALRARRDDIAARCTLGAVYAKRNDLPRAALYLGGCSDADLPDEIGVEIRKTDRELKKKLRDLSTIEVVTRPAGMTIVIDKLPGESVVAPATIWVKPGKYKLTATAGDRVLAMTIDVGERARVPAILEAPAGTKIAPREQRVDFSQENAAETQQSGPPPAVKHKTMLPPKYQGEVASAVNENALDDPMAARATARRPARALWLGARLGGGMYDDAATGARAGMTIGATARYRLAPRYFLAGRLDWSRRGGESIDAVDSIGASAGVGATVLDGDRLAIALIGQLRGDLRFADTRQTSGSMMEPVSRAGAGAALGVEAALPSTPITIGLRFEQGLTTLVPDARDRAILLEVGADWR
ncbi:MAG TPA: hypothetical protein VIU61_09765 [Kofleriaceae bacterium]